MKYYDNVVKIFAVTASNFIVYFFNLFVMKVSVATKACAPRAHAGCIVRLSRFAHVSVSSQVACPILSCWPILTSYTPHRTKAFHCCFSWGSFSLLWPWWHIALRYLERSLEYPLSLHCSCVSAASFMVAYSSPVSCALA